MLQVSPPGRKLASGGTLEPTLFEAEIVPHRSLSARGQRRVLVFLAVLLFAGTSVCALAGAWPVGGFAGLELLAAILFFRWHGRQARARETVLLSPGALRIIRVDGAGRRRERSFPPAWLTARIEERPGRAASLVLTGRGVREEIGAELGEAERRDLGAALDAALHRLRNPVFDNAVLRGD
jgi:uncharacterized membrane protein